MRGGLAALLIAAAGCAAYYRPPCSESTFEITMGQEAGRWGTGTSSYVTVPVTPANARCLTYVLTGVDPTEGEHERP